MDKVFENRQGRHPGNDDYEEYMADVKKHIGPKEGYTEGPFGRSRHDNAKAPWDKVSDKLIRIFEAPVEWFHDKVVIPNRRTDLVYYHKKYKRVPTADTCYMDDFACRYEANQQYLRDRQIDDEIMEILRDRMKECFTYHGGWYAEHAYRLCEGLQRDALQAEVNFKIKYGNGQCGAPTATRAYLRQRIRMTREELYFMWMRDHKDQLGASNAETAAT
ncbi:NADH dehydrogenase (ubiquinone) PDSW subunit [Brevipalpus obovatus]|uniref:NADH dehydrogenase (ubiquinone) PDSW subunit n=1 Tax=Brevipalpus obovatus TaxID=246614 RepID=UPI003D9DC868